MEPIDRLIAANELLIQANKALIGEYRKVRRYVVFSAALLVTVVSLAASLVAMNSRRMADRIVMTIFARQETMLQILHDEGWCPTTKSDEPELPAPEDILPRGEFSE